MQRLIPGLVLFQFIAICALLVLIINQNRAINDLATRIDSIGVNREADMELDTSHDLDSSQNNIWDQQHINNTLAEIKKQLAVQTKLLTQTQPNSVQDAPASTEKAMYDSDSYGQLEAQVSHYVSLGDISEEQLASLMHEASHLPQADRDRLFKKMAQELNRQ